MAKSAVWEVWLSGKLVAVGSRQECTGSSLKTGSMNGPGHIDRVYTQSFSLVQADPDTQVVAPAAKKWSRTGIRLGSDLHTPADTTTLTPLLE